MNGDEFPAMLGYDAWREDNNQQLESMAGNHAKVWGLPVASFRGRNTEEPSKWQRFLLRWFL